jgi:LysR family transcriptional regulator for metE and metH
MFELRDLRLIVAVCDEGGVTNAGRVLNLTQSAVSHQLGDLERELGSPLFNRIGRKLVPTPLGARLADRAREVLILVDRAEKEVKRLATGTEVSLRVSTECYTVYHWLPGVLQSYRRKYPRTDVEIVSEATRRPIPALLDGEIDLGIVTERSDNPNVAFSPLFRDELVVILSPDHRLARRPFIEAADFRGQRLFTYRVAPTELAYYRQVLQPTGVRPDKIVQMELTEGIVELVRAGMGISVLARWAVAQYLTTGDLVGLPLTAGGFYRDWFAATLATTRDQPYVRDFISAIARTPRMERPKQRIAVVR